MKSNKRITKSQIDMLVLQAEREIAFERANMLKESIRILTRMINVARQELWEIGMELDSDG